MKKTLNFFKISICVFAGILFCGCDNTHANQMKSDNLEIDKKNHASDIVEVDEETHQYDVSRVRNNEILDRQNFQKNIQVLFENNKFDELNKIYIQLLKSEERTSSGLWKLTVFYDSFDKILTAKEEEQSKKIWESHYKKISKWSSEYPNIALPEILKAKLLLARAWQYRGEGYISTVSTENLKQWNTYLTKANDYLNHKIPSLSNVDPEWHVVNLDVKSFLNNSELEYKSALEDATNRFPYYYPIYFNAVVYHYSPKWGGDYEEIEKFAHFAVSKTNAKEGTAIYSRIYWVVADNMEIDKLRKESYIDWQYFRKSVREVLKQYPDQWNFSNYIYISCQVKDKKFTSELFQGISFHDLNNWKNEYAYENCLAFAKGTEDELMKEREQKYMEQLKKDYPEYFQVN